MTMRLPVERRAPEKAAFPAWAGPAERLRYLLRYAILAPSRHNSQPWLFEIEGPELRVYGDWRRALKVADPQGRELAMACGAALFNVEVAARHYGHATSLETGSGTRKDGLLGRLRLEERRSPSPDGEALFAAIQGAVLRVVERSVRSEVGELVAEGDRIQWASGRFRAELASWSRSNDGATFDGMPGYAHGLSDSASFLHRMLVRLRGRHDEAQRAKTYALHTRALLALCTRDDGPSAWFLAGQAMQRALLRATAAGMSASYFSQAVEVAPVREKLRAALGERGFPQLLFRLGFGVRVRATPRRPVDLVLRCMTSSAPDQAIMRPAEVELDLDVDPLASLART